MEKRFDNLEAKVDKLDTRLDGIDIGLTKQNAILESQHESLKEHMKRSDLLEAKVLPMEKFIDRLTFSGILLGSLGSLAFALSEMGLLKKLLAFFSI